MPLECQVKVEDLLTVLESVMPANLNLDTRPLPGIDPLVDTRFLSRYETGVDCDAVFGGRILIGNL